MTSIPVVHLATLEPEKDEITEAADAYLGGMDQMRRYAIEAEARRLRERLSLIPFYADKERRHGVGSWVMLALSYEGED